METLVKTSSSSAIGGRPLGGGFVAAWTRQSDLNVRIFDADGSAILPRFSIANSETIDPGPRPVVVGVLQNGRFVVAWLTETAGVLAGQIFERNGSPAARVRIRDKSGRLERNLAGALLSAKARGFALAYIDTAGLQMKEVRGDEITVIDRLEDFGAASGSELNDAGFVAGWLSSVGPQEFVTASDVENGKPVREAVLLELRNGGFITTCVETEAIRKALPTLWPGPHRVVRTNSKGICRPGEAPTGPKQPEVSS